MSSIESQRLVGSSNSHQRIRSFDWSSTPLGPISAWPDELLFAAEYVLENRFPAALFWGPDLITIYNDAFRPILGDKPEALGRPLAEIRNEIWPEIRVFVQRALNGESTFIEDLPLVVNRTGRQEQAYFTFSYSPVRDRDGTVVGFIDTVVETTSKVLTHFKIQEAEERMRLAVTTTGLGVFDWDLVTDRVTVNQRFHDMLMLPSDSEVTAAHFLAKVVHPADLALANARIGAALDCASSGRYEFEHRAITPGGELWVLSSGQVIFDKSGSGPRALRIVGNLLDITERRLSEQRLRESEQSYRDLANSLPQIIWQTDADGIITYVNERIVEVTGQQPSDTIGKPWLFNLHPDDHHRLETSWDKASQTGDAYEAELRLTSATGEVRWFLSRGAPVKSENGAILRWVGSETDFTDRKRAEDQTRILMREVNHRSKNILAVVQAIARLTAEETDPRTFSLRFGERLQALASSQDLIVRNDWNGVELSALVKAHLAHFNDLFDNRIHINGPDLVVSAAAAQNLGLALHELGTNAGKYGSLSNASGTLHISWHISDQEQNTCLILKWQEQHGPAVSPPQRRGLGSLLITSVTEQAFTGKVHLEFAPAGVVWQLTAPLAGMVET